MTEPSVDLEDLGLDEGAHLLIKRALTAHPRIRVHGRVSALASDLPAWCRVQGHSCEVSAEGFTLTRSPHDRWRRAERAGTIDAPVDAPPAHWGLAARGALVEAGASQLELSLHGKRDVWADEAARLYAQAAAAQWDRRWRFRGMPRPTIPTRSRTRSFRS